MKQEDLIKYQRCIKCEEPVVDRGMTVFEDRPGDGFFVTACDNRECERYGLLTTVTK